MLLKNKDDVLPLKGKKIAVTGYPAASSVWRAAGSAKVVPCRRNPRRCTTALKKKCLPRKSIFGGARRVGHNAFTDFRGAVVKASDADVAVVCVGTGERIEYEGTDREHIRLTRYEEDLIHEVAAVNPETVVVVYAGSAIDMSDWIDEVKAVVFAGFGGERVQTAVAGVLSGRVNPSGKITETFPYAAEDVPAYNMPCNSHVCRYLEGLDVGYRYFKGENVLFPFGYGLSYSKFEYTDMKVVKKGEFDYRSKSYRQKHVG